MSETINHENDPFENKAKTIEDFIKLNVQDFTFQQLMFLLYKRNEFLSVIDNIYVFCRNLNYTPHNQVHDVKFLHGSVNVIINYGGIFGIDGPLFDNHLDLIREMDRKKDFAIRDFLHIFDNMVAEKFYLAKARTNLSLHVYQNFNSVMTIPLLALAGMNLLFSKHDELQIRDYRKFFPISNMLWSKPKTAFNLRKILEYFFECDVNILENQEYKVKCDSKDVLRLGMNKCTLGSVFLGTHLRFNDAIHIHVFVNKESFLPNNSTNNFEKLKILVNYYLGPLYKYKISVRMLSKKYQKNIFLGWNAVVNATNEYTITSQIQSDHFYDDEMNNEVM
ncbi:type VI secretion system baseplate subunit TssG [Candidatus Gromoviella agglomerans]|uniref:type VI secretion system baseplate subunit TssG n=1 Tax=Candidatus Gromoviella agglomerans TaxID=2806609 RepID=UPI001E53ACF4|nr:type VI secretion system baseplate subunit TssG [Candidatus Gromoviella agglomerans]UFX98370.1 Type VI secretion system baseplate subunit TssG [Candidatus Gromoviella agglomerans]